MEHKQGVGVSHGGVVDVWGAARPPVLTFVPNCHSNSVPELCIIWLMPAYRIGIDTGGTFSDFCVLNQDTGEMTTTKVPSTPGDPSLSVISGLRQLFAGNIKPEEITSFCYSTTVGTNALLEGKVEKTGVLLTAGLTGINDIYEGAATSWDKYDPYCFRPKSLVPLRLRQEVEERLDFRGNVVKPLDILQARQAIEKLLKQKVTSFAVCLLFSFLNPSHEKQIGALIREMAPGCQVCLSSEVLPQIREYFRLSTTVVDAMIGPVLGRFLARLARELVQNGVKTRQLYIMQSNGGVRTLSA
ncbi:MAG: hydantoinase/oxoprolinase family protein, partial [Chloroflexi bacterium]|nr:hydantoinase/oxoprolinase family protein [Chloroflexota bacterium]